MEKPVLFEVQDGIAILTLNRPERRNAINQSLLVHLFDAIDEVAADPQIRVAVLTGKGVSFCSGIDLAVIGSENLFDPRGDGRDFPEVIGACRKPVIGAINGHAITGGLEVALNCDFLIASERASFADTHARVGIQPGWGMTQLLQQAVGRRMALQMSLTCQFVSAQRALEIGLVNEVVPHERLMPRALEVARQILEAKPDVLAVIKELIEVRDRTTMQGGLAEERKAFMRLLESSPLRR